VTPLTLAEKNGSPRNRTTIVEQNAHFPTVEKKKNDAIAGAAGLQRILRFLFHTRPAQGRHSRFGESVSIKSLHVPCDRHSAQDRTMRTLQAAVTLGVVLGAGGAAMAQAPASVGTEEFGLTPRQLVQSAESVEALIARCMRESGFQYIAADYNTVRQGMAADKYIEGLSEEEFIRTHGFGISTMYTGTAPQLTDGYSPGREGLGEQNVRIFRNLSAADQVAYNRALLGDHVTATFAVGLETEDFSRTGGCTRRAIEQVFQPDQLKATYYNPKDALINSDPRMKAALREYAVRMRKAGFDYSHPDDVEPDIMERLVALTQSGRIRVDQMSADQRAALRTLQDYERRVAVESVQLAEELFEPVEVQIEQEMFAREVK
jgi:hypothetical protein